MKGLSFLGVSRIHGRRRQLCGRGFNKNGRNWFIHSMLSGRGFNKMGVVVQLFTSPVINPSQQKFLHGQSVIIKFQNLGDGYKCIAKLFQIVTLYGLPVP